MLYSGGGADTRSEHQIAGSVSSDLPSHHHHARLLLVLQDYILARQEVHDAAADG